MNVWIIFAGETLPMDAVTRTWRYGMLAETLAARGHSVTRWAPTFNHAHKKQRYHTNYIYNVNENYKIKLLYNRRYKRNIGFQRLLSYIQLASSFHRCIKNEKPPDIIISGMPTPWLCYAAIKYGQQKHIPVVIDIRDLWPDIFLEVVPKKLQWLAELVMLPLFKMNHYVFEKASGITAISSNYIKWGLAYSGRKMRNTEKVFYMGYPKKNLSASEKKESERWWIGKGVRQNSFLCCFFGSINYQFDLETVISAAKVFKSYEDNNVQFVLCGDGVNLVHYKKLARGLNNIIFPGWVDPFHINTLMEWSNLGLTPYKSFSSNISHKFHLIKYPLLEIGEKATLSNKISEYFSGNLPIVSSLRGELEQILLKNDCGLTYEAGDVQGLVDAIQYLRNNTEKRVQMSKNSECLFEREFCSDKVYPEMADHIENIAKIKKRKSAD